MQLGENSYARDDMARFLPGVLICCVVQCRLYL